MKYRVKTGLISNIPEGEEINELQLKGLLDEGCPKDWFEQVDRISVGDWVTYINTANGDKGVINHTFQVHSIDSDGWLIPDDGSRFEGRTYHRKHYRKALPHEIENEILAQIRHRKKSVGKINGYSINLDATDEHTEIGCRTVPNIVFDNLAHYCRSYDLTIIREGDDITEQIKNIAEYYDR